MKTKSKSFCLMIWAGGTYRKRHRPARGHDTYIKEEMLKKAAVDLEVVFKKRAGKE